MTDIQTLPRSLDPLPEESLPGYLLRLSHRLGLTPARMAARTGLAAPSRFASWIPSGLLLQLPPSVRDDFASATRLRPAEIDMLTLDSLSTRYPIPPAEFGHRSATTIRLSRWVFAPATRYCPQCLAGDDTAIQRAYGGAWRTSWHLPVVFACVHHHELLHHICPHCHQPVHGNGTETPIRLLPNMRNNALHPLQCRAETTPGKGKRLPICCGGRLDLAPSASSHPVNTDTLGLQQRILDLLRPDGPEVTTSAGLPTEPVRYFADLRLLTLLICQSWPALRSMAPPQQWLRPSITTPNNSSTTSHRYRNKIQPPEPITPATPHLRTPQPAPACWQSAIRS